MADRTLDTSGLTCPIPILKAKRVLRELAPGSTLEVIATDPGSIEDFRTFAELTGDTLLEHSENEGVYRFLLRKKA